MNNERILKRVGISKEVREDYEERVIHHQNTNPWHMNKFFSETSELHLLNLQSIQHQLTWAPENMKQVSFLEKDNKTPRLGQKGVWGQSELIEYQVFALIVISKNTEPSIWHIVGSQKILADLNLSKRVKDGDLIFPFTWINFCSVKLIKIPSQDDYKNDLTGNKGAALKRKFTMLNKASLFIFMTEFTLSVSLGSIPRSRNVVSWNICILHVLYHCESAKGK